MIDFFHQAVELAQKMAREHPELLLPVLVWDLENLSERALEILASEDERLGEPAEPEDWLRLEHYREGLRIAIETGDQGGAIQAGANLADLLRLKLRPWQEPVEEELPEEEDDLFRSFDEGLFTDL